MKLFNVQDLLNRANQLESSLNWVEFAEDGKKAWRLVSNETHRVVDTIYMKGDGTFEVGKQEGYKQTYVNLQSVQHVTKFSAICNILADDLNRRYVQ